MPFAMTNRETSPHRAVIWVRAEVHDVNDRGECSGRVATRIQEFPVVIDGADKNICTRKLNEALEEFKKLCRDKST